MRVTIDKTHPVVTVKPSARTMADIEDAALNESPHGMNRTLHAANKRWALHPDGAYLAGVACTGCDATTNTRAGTPALRRRAGSYPGMCEAAVCTICQAQHTPSKLARVLLTKEERPRVRIEPTRWYVVRCGGGKARIGHDFTHTATQVATSDFNPDEDLEALVVLVYDQAHAAEVLRQETKLPWTVVPVTGSCEPRPEWHGLSLSATEQAALGRARRVQRNRDRQALESKVANFRAQLQAEQSA